MSLEDVEYYRRRARQERELAVKTTDPKAAKAHEELALSYEGLVRHAGWLPDTRLDASAPSND